MDVRRFDSCWRWDGDVGELMVLGSLREILKAYFEDVWVCWMERSGDDGCEGEDIVKVRMADSE